MSDWFWYAMGAAILYGLHQVFTKLAAPHISDGLGGLLVESTAALTIGTYLLGVWLSGRWHQTAAAAGVGYSVLTGLCVGVGTLFFFLLFQRGGPLSVVPAILAAGAALMAAVGIVAFGEPARPLRLLGIGLSVAGLYLLR
jgi:transporter family protein